MDTSKEYIEMCEKAQEIQNYVDSKPLKEGFFFRVQQHQRDVHHFANGIFITGDIWLPRQDQLQDLVFQYKDAHNVLIEFHQDCLKEYEKSKSVVLSFEKLWLIFIMKTIYNKYWGFHKKEWILIS